MGQPEHSVGAVGRRMASGAAWMVLMRLFVRSIGLVSTVVLARVLVPEDFGLVILAVSIVFLIEVLGDFGFEWVLIRYPGRDKTLYDSAWTLGLIKALILATVLVLAALPFALLYEKPALEGVLYVLALNALLVEGRNIGIVEFRKELNFHKEFIIQAVKKLMAFLVTICLAVLWRDHWALVLGIVAGNLAFLAASFVMHPYRPSLDLSRWRELIGFSVWVMLNGVVGALSNRLPALVLGKFVSARELGFYFVGKEVAELPTTELVWPIATALYPGYAKFANDPGALRVMYLASYELIFLLGAPVGVGIALAAPWFVPLLLGEQWGPAVPVVQVLAVAGVIRVLSTGAGSMYLTLGRPKLQFVVSLTGLIVSAPMIVVLTMRMGVDGAVYGLFGSYGATTLLHILVTSRLLGLPWHYPVTKAWRPIVALSLMAVAVTLLPWSGAPGVHFGTRALELGGIALIGAATYVLVLGLLWIVSGRPEGAESRCLGAMQAILDKVRGRTTAR